MAQSNTPTIDVMNITMAAFEGRKFYGHTIDKFGGDTHNALPDMKYHTSWDWLMPVWKKAAAIIYGIRGELTKIDYLAAHRVTKEFIDACQKVEIEKAHRAVFEAVAGITWLNQQKQKDA